MKIKVEKWITDEYESESYKILSMEKCCDDLIISPNITINYEENEKDHHQLDREYSVKLIRCECDVVDSYGYDKYYYESIKYCPHCGELIEIQIVSEINKIEERKKLRKERDILWKKCCGTDSKKEADILKQQVRELDDKLNYILTSDGFEKYDMRRNE